MSSSVARRYADALVELASEKKVLDTVVSDLGTFGSVLTSSSELESALSNPGFSPEERQSALGVVLEQSKADRITRNFLFLLIDNGRMAAFSDIHRAFEERVDEHLGRVRATVTSATPLESGMLGEIENQVKHLTGKDTVVLTAEVDPALIGGIVTRVGDLVLDGSIRTQLSTIRNQLLGQTTVGEA